MYITVELLYKNHDCAKEYLISIKLT